MEEDDGEGHTGHLAQFGQDGHGGASGQGKTSG